MQFFEFWKENRLLHIKKTMSLILMTGWTASHLDEDCLWLGYICNNIKTGCL